MKKLNIICFFTILVIGGNLLIAKHNPKLSFEEVSSIEQLSLNNISLASEGGTCIADDPGECAVTATCPSGGNSVCCVGYHCASGTSFFGDDYWVECDYAGKSWVYC